MDRDKLKIMIKDLKNVVNALECEIYSDKESYTLNLNYCLLYTSDAADED